MAIIKMVTTQLTWVALALNVTMRSATARLRALLLRLTVKVPSSTLISTFFAVGGRVRHETRFLRCHGDMAKQTCCYDALARGG